MPKCKHTGEIIDVSAFVANELKPERPLTITSGSVWKARVEPLDLAKPDGSLAWSLVRDGDLIRIPLIPYRVAGTDATQVLLVAMHIMQRYQEAMPAAIRTHIIIGAPIEELAAVEGEEASRFWLGFAARLH